MYMDRDLELENRIKERYNYDRLHKINSYGGMGMDGISTNKLKIILEELDYIKKHLEIFQKNIKTDDNSMYLITPFLI